MMLPTLFTPRGNAGQTLFCTAGRGVVALMVLFCTVSGARGQGDTDELRERFRMLTDSGLYPEALETNRELLAAWAQRNDPDSTAFYTYRRAHILGLSGDFQASVGLADSLIKALVGRKRAPSFLGSIYYTAGSNRLYLGQFDQGKALLDSGLHAEALRPDPDTLVLAKCTEWKGIISIYSGSIDTAAKLIEAALDLRCAIFDSTAKEIAYNLNSLGSVYEEVGRYDDARGAYQEAYDILSEKLPENHPHTLSVLSNLAILEASIGDISTAIEMLERAIAGHRALGMNYALMNEYFNLGSIYSDLQDFERAEPYMYHALALADSVLPEFSLERANLYDGVGSIKYHFGEAAQADSLFRLAQNQRLGVGDASPTQLGQSVFNLGLVAQDQKDYEQAEGYFRRALSYFAESLGPRNPKTTNAEYALAEIQWERGQQLEALKTFLSCREKYRTSVGPRHRWALEAGIKVARSQMEMGQRGTAETTLNQVWADVFDIPVNEVNLARLDARPIGFSEPILIDLIALEYDILLESPDPTSTKNRESGHALSVVLDAVLERMWPLIAFDNGNDALLATIKSAYIKCIRFAALQPDSDLRARADVFRAIGQSNALGVRAAIQNRKAMRFAQVPDSMVEAERRLSEELKYIAAKNQSDDREGWQDREFRALDRYRLLHKALKEKYPRWYAMRYNTTAVDPTGVQRILGRDGASLLAYVDMDTVLLAVTADKDRYETTVLDVPHSWRDSVKSYVALVKTLGGAEQSPRMTRLGGYLYGLLWRPLASQLAEKVCLVPDGVLNYLNFETLPVEAPASGRFRDVHWLIQDHNILLIDALPGDDKAERGVRRELLAVVPGFDDTLKREYRNSLPEGTAPDTVFEQWTRTPWSVEFAKNIGKRGTALIGDQATETAYRKNADKAQILHFGTHALMQDKEPLLSYLALVPTPGQNENEDADGYLHAYELYNQKLNARLALLTACETGLGTYRQGDGVISLAHAFRYAGCPAIIYSLWQIDDQSSTQIIESFYDNLDGNLSFSDGLRNAKLDYLSNGTDAMASPYYWGGLVLRGQDGHVLKHRGWKYVSWWTAVILLVLLAAVLFFSNRRKKKRHKAEALFHDS